MFCSIKLKLRIKKFILVHLHQRFEIKMSSNLSFQVQVSSHSCFEV
ncbi:unnamed protein product [Chironomus riparius]|uniref:Uncharacterized protein n=1 Tax=Chironomus riparius TaxID=315576 RepID=A0A9N9RJA2_9DIPT|nr:unnamed protein product [Chironomus riparius]